MECCVSHVEEEVAAIFFHEHARVIDSVSRQG